MSKIKTERISPNAVREGEEVVIDNPICHVCGLGSKSRIPYVKYLVLMSAGMSDDSLIDKILPLKTAAEKRKMKTGIHKYCEGK